MKLMHVDSSPKGEKSNSRMLAREFIAMLRERDPELEVDYLDLAENVPSHVTGDFAAAAYTPVDQRTEKMRATLAESDRLCARLLEADALLFAMPMYNWSMPSSFKAFIDAIVRNGVTFGTRPDGTLEGRLSRQKVLFLTTRGSDLGPGSPFQDMDALTPALRAAFGFIGVSEPQFVNAEPMEFAMPEQRVQGLERARRELAQVAEQWAEPAYL